MFLALPYDFVCAFLFILLCCILGNFFFVTDCNCHFSYIIIRFVQRLFQNLVAPLLLEKEAVKCNILLFQPLNFEFRHTLCKLVPQSSGFDFKILSGTYQLKLCTEHSVSVSHIHFSRRTSRVSLNYVFLLFFIWTLKRVFAQKCFCCPAWMKSHSCQIQELAIHCLWTVFLLTIWGLPLCVTVSSLVSYLGLIPSFSVFYSLILVTCYSWWMKYLHHQENCKNGYHLLALMASQSPISIHKICHFEL